MNTLKIKHFIIKHEGTEFKGRRLRPYRCPAGKLTIGYGRNLDDNGISHDEAIILLENDILECVSDLNDIFPCFPVFSENRQIALIDMVFNLGRSGFCNFQKMISAIERGDWEEAAKQALDSKWSKQVGQRAIDDAELIKRG